MSDQGNFTVKTMLFSMLGGAIVVIVCFLLWCRKAPTHPPGPPKQGGTGLLFVDRPVNASDLLVSKDDFRKTNFRRKNATTAQPLDSCAVLMEVVDFDKKIDSLESVYGKSLAIIFHHGLRVQLVSAVTDYLYDPLITFAKLTKDPVLDAHWSAAPINGAKFAVDADGKLSPSLGAAWTGDASYKSDIRIWRTGTAAQYDPFIEGMDVENYTIGVDELQKLLDNNAGKAKFVKALSVAEALDIDDGHAWHMRHHVCLVTTAGAADGYKENVDDGATPTSAPYLNRAMDVGSPCPPRCRKVFLPEHGIPVRTKPWP